MAALKATQSQPSELTEMAIAQRSKRNYKIAATTATVAIIGLAVILGLSTGFMGLPHVIHISSCTMYYMGAGIGISLFSSIYLWGKVNKQSMEIEKLERRKKNCAILQYNRVENRRIVDEQERLMEQNRRRPTRTLVSEVGRSLDEEEYEYLFPIEIEGISYSSSTDKGTHI